MIFILFWIDINMLFFSFTESRREQQFMFAMTLNMSKTLIAKSLSTYNSQ